MNKELIIENAKNRFNGDLLDIVLKQIDDYFKLSQNKVINNKYQIGDKVILNENNLLHGIGKHTDLIELFSKRGILSQDFFGDDSNHAFCYTAAFWTVEKEISLEEYIKRYSGMVVNINKEYHQIPYGKLDEFVEKVKEVDHWLWTAESSMEIRFMPSLARNINQIGFILNTDDELSKKMRHNSVFKSNFNKDYAMEFVSEKAQEKFKIEGFTSDFFYRADYIIFGYPVNSIEGILVGREIENDENYLNQLKKLFPNCYISNLDGKVIY